MNRPSVAIAIGVIVLYSIFGPLILYAIYTLLDSFSQKKESQAKDKDTSKEVDPALWSGEDVKTYLRNHNKYDTD